MQLLYQKIKLKGLNGNMGMDYKKMIKNSRLEAGKLMTEEQIAACNVAIHTAAVASGGAGFIPIPVADAVPISLAQIAMVVALGKIFDQEISESTAKGIISAAAATFVGRNLIKFIPIAGWIASAGVAAGVTEAIGWAVAVDFAKSFRKEVNRRKSNAEAAEAQVEAAYYKHEDNKAEDFGE